MYMPRGFRTDRYTPAPATAATASTAGRPGEMGKTVALVIVNLGDAPPAVATYARRHKTRQQPEGKIEP